MMGQVVDQYEIRMDLECPIQIKLTRADWTRHDLSRRDLLQSFQKCLCILAPVRFDDSNHNLAPCVLDEMSSLKHGIGLADTSRGAQKHFE